jgi:hypothetical protein
MTFIFKYLHYCTLKLAVANLKEPTYVVFQVSVLMD